MTQHLNMYDILEKLRSVSSNSEAAAAAVQQVTALNAVQTPKDRIDEKYMGWDKTVAAIKKGGSADNPEAVAAAIGRKKYGKEKFQKAAAAGKKLGEGEVEESGLQAYLGKKKYGETGMKALQKAGREGASKEKMAMIRAKHDKMDEGAKPDFLDFDKDGNKKEPMKKALKDKNNADYDETGIGEDGRLTVSKTPQGTEVQSSTGRVKATFEPGKPTKVEPGKPTKVESGAKMGEGMIKADVNDILRKHRRDVNRFRKMGDLSDALYNDLYDHYRDQMPHGTAQAKTGDPYTWIANKLDKIISMPEGNAFGNEVRKAKADGIQKGEKIKVGGQEYPLKEKMSAAKAKKFAALAEPRDKITYADKIAGAQKTEESFPSKEDALKRMKEKEGRTSKGKVEKTAHGIKHTRHYDADADDEKTTPAGEKRGRGRPKKYTGDAPRQERITARSRKKDRTAHGQSGFKTSKRVKEEQPSMMDRGEYDQEGDMAKDQLHTLMSAAKELHSILGDDQNMPEWVQTKITKALDYINASRDYMDQESHDADPMVSEKAKSVAQQRFMGMAHAMQKGEKIKGASKELKKVAGSMKKGDVEDFAKTKHKGLPQHVKKKTTETTVAGGMAPVAMPMGKMRRRTEEDGGPGGVAAEKPYQDPKTGKTITPPKGATQPPADSPFPPGDKRNMKPVKKAAAPQGDEAVAETDTNPTDGTSKASKGSSKGGMQFGKGIYDSMNRELESMIAENMSINTSMDSDGHKSINISASEEDADKLAEILKMAGLGGGDEGMETCPDCGMENCGCDHIDEVTHNEPDYPVNPGEEQDDVYMITTLAGGLNKPKRDQTTLPHTAVKVSEEDVVENIEYKLWNSLKRMD